MVYIIRRANSDDFKIGYTRGSAADRLSQLQVGSPDPLHVYATIIHGTPSTEKRIHEALQKYALRGEWFRLPPEVLENVLSRLVGIPDMKRNNGRTIAGKVDGVGTYCAECDDLIPSGTRYCSSACKERSEKRERKRSGAGKGGARAAAGKPCPVCGLPLTKRQKWCSEACKAAANRGADLYTCVECGSKMSEGRTTKYCSDACVNAAVQRKNGKPRQVIHSQVNSCKRCGSPVNSRQLYCSGACKQADYRDRRTA